MRVVLTFAVLGIKSDLETSATSFLGWWTVDGATANSNMSLQPILHVEWH